MSIKDSLLYTYFLFTFYYIIGLKEVLKYESIFKNESSSSKSGLEYSISAVINYHNITSS